MTRPRSLLAPLLILSLLSPLAAAGKRKAEEAPPIVRQALSLAAEDRGEALALLEGYLAEGSSPDLLAVAALYAGEQRRLYGDPVAAREHFDTLRERWGDADAAEHASLGLALLDYDESPSGNTLATLEFLDEAGAPATMNADRYRILAVEAAAAGASQSEVQSLARKALAYAEADPLVAARARRSLAELVPEAIGDEGAAAALPPGDGADAEALRRAREALASGDLSRATRQAEALIKTFPDSPYARAARWVVDLAAANKPYEPMKIGVLLPLSGTYAPPGQQIRQALEYAARGSGVELIFRDTEGSPDKSREQLEGLVLDHGVGAVIGPLLKENAHAVAPEAQAAGVPLITLTQTPGITAAGDYVFRGGLTAEQQVEALTDYTMGTMGLRRFAVMAPSNAFGAAARDAFIAAVDDRGGRVTHAVMYDPTKTAFAAEAAELQDMDFDAIFIPDGWQRVVLVASSLAYAELAVGGFSPGFKRDPVPLLGLNGWHNQTLADQGGQYVQNSYFVDVYDADEGEPDMQSFAASYEAGVGRSPGVLEALAYDTAQLVFIAARELPKSREDFREALLSAELRGSVTGGEGFDEARELRRHMMVYTIAEVSEDIEDAQHINRVNVIRRVD